MVKDSPKTNNGNCLNLSEKGYKEIPMDEIGTNSKAVATNIDLSSNNITKIPPSFCLLYNICKLDLSKNKIDKLPYNFGELSQLRHLELHTNKIKELPVSFGQLKMLKWLDLKNNPLEHNLKKVAGDCADSKQCKDCAKKVVLYMQEVQEQLVLKKDAQAIKVAHKSHEEKDAKKSNKEKKNTSQAVTQNSERRNAGNSTNDKRAKAEAATNNAATNPLTKNGKVREKKPPTTKQRKSGCCYYLSLFLALLFLLASTAACILCMYTGGDFSGSAIQEALPRISADVIKLTTFIQLTLKNLFIWSTNDGLEIAKNATIYAGVVFQDIGNILTLSCNHIQKQFEKFVISSTMTMTTTPNIKNM